MPLQIVIPDKDPLVEHLSRRAVKRGMAPNVKSARKQLTKLARSLITEQLGNLEQNGDPLELNPRSN